MYGTIVLYVIFIDVYIYIYIYIYTFTGQLAGGYVLSIFDVFWWIPPLGTCWLSNWTCLSGSAMRTRSWICARRYAKELQAIELPRGIAVLFSSLDSLTSLQHVIRGSISCDPQFDGFEAVLDCI